MRRLILAAALAAALSGCGHAPSQPGLALRVDRKPFNITVVQDGKTVVTEDKVARLTYLLGTPKVLHRLTKVTSSQGGVYQVATDEPGRTATVTLRRIPEGFRVSVRLHPATNVDLVYDAFKVDPNAHFLGGGERGGQVDLHGEIVPVKASYVCSSAPVPFFASTAGWGLRLATWNVAAFAFPGSSGGPGCRFGDEFPCAFEPLKSTAEVCVQGSQLDEELYVGTLPKLLAAYEARAGAPAVPPPSELELVKWRDVASGPADIYDDVARLQAARIPLGSVILDNPWETCNGSLTFNSSFPNPGAMIGRVHAHGVKFMLWVSPKVLCSVSGYPASGLLGPPGHEVLDLTDPAIVAEFQARLRKVFALGVDGVKGDRGDEVDLEGVSEPLQNVYPLLFARVVLGALPHPGPSIFRAGAMGSQRIVPGLWGGDQEGSFEGLQTAIRLGETAAMSGFPVWGSDIGGYSSAGLTPEVFARWAELGAVSPVMEVGGTGPNAVPWTLGAEAMSVLRDTAVLHYELFPYLYGLLERRQPVLRPLGYGFPDDPGAWRADLEFLVGPDLLAAPVIGGGTTPSVYLPAGNWVDLYSGGQVAGGSSFTRDTPLAQFPLYARAGAVLPFNLRTATGSWWGVNELTHPGRAGFLATNGARIALQGQPRDVQIFVPAPRRPARVTLAGRAVAWSWSAGPLPGAVVRLHGPTLAGRIVASPA